MRRAISVMVGGWGVTVAVVCSALLVVSPQNVRALPTSGSDPTGWLIFPLTISVGVAGALMLVWAAVRGYRCAADPARWCRRMRTALWACALGAALSIFCAAAAGTPWTGMPATARGDGFLALTVHSGVALLIMLAMYREPGFSPGGSTRA